MDEIKEMVREHVGAAVAAGITVLPDGMTVDKWLETRELRPTGPRRLRGGANPPKRRYCLTCSHPFLSAGAHHRVCPICQGRDTSHWDFS